MSGSLQPYVGYVDVASHSTHNISYASWVIYSLNGELLNLQGICIGHSTNNIVEYSTLIELICDVISIGILCL